MANQDENKTPDPAPPPVETPVVRDKALKGPGVAGGFKGDVHALLARRQGPAVDNLKDGD